MEHITSRAAGGLRRRARTLVTSWTDDVRALGGAQRVLGLLEPVAHDVVELVARALEGGPAQKGTVPTALRRLVALQLSLDEPWKPLVDSLRPLARRIRHAVRAELLELDAPAATLLAVTERADDAVEQVWAELVLALDGQEVAHRLRQGQYLASFGRPLAHDLRNHAYAVQMQLRLLEEEQIVTDPERRERLLRRARDAVRGVGTVSIEHVERWVAEPGTASPPVPFPDLLTDVVRQVQATRADAEITVGGPVPCRRVPDGDRVWLALHLIASFAVERTAEPPRITLRAHDTLDVVLVEVRDHGPSVDPMELATLFDPPRPEGHTAPPPSGLWLARRALAHLGGEVVVGEAPRGGLVFTLTVPRLAAAARAV